ncbi:nonsense-mediated mRNA decay protein 2 [Cajanus cajan]|uniref:nonsense-mediated mRNA decay protein 2 n=1 Tax=Cajanus cajan TaxID=3821 RepID=UPI00098DC7FB|nr:nonsense-mediated mRNA decay protein 2 [Cajanus cajan]
MGCFMACFGLSNKRKRRKTLYKVLAPHQKYGNYEVLAITERSIIQDSELRGRDEVKEKNSVKSKKKKKVTFNLNVQVYELNPTAYQVLNNEEEENKNNSAELEGSAALPVRYPTNHRYYNCGDGYDEGDEIEYEDEYDEDDEFDDDDDDEYDWDDDGSEESLEKDEAEVYDENTKQKELSESCYPSVADDKIKNQMPLDSSNAELKSNLSGRDRSIMHSVLIPVENLTQWKAIKTKVPSSSKHRRKENVPSSKQHTSMPLVTEASLNFSPCSLESNALQSKPLLPETAVDASLSNWLISPNYPLSSTTIHCQ